MSDDFKFLNTVTHGHGYWGNRAVALLALPGLLQLMLVVYLAGRVIALRQRMRRAP